LLSEGALSHARAALGFEVFQQILNRFSATITLTPDFHALTTMIFDGTTMTMPDSEKNRAAFGKHSTQHGQAGFPQLRMVALVVGATHLVLDLAFAACRGKGTGERSLMKEILKRLNWKCWLLLFDAGFYSFELAWTIQQRDERFLMKVKQSLKLAPIKGSAYGDGSFLAIITGKVDGQMQQMTVRVLDCQLRGFRPFRLITNLLDEKITAREIVVHYHQRWEVEIAFDEIKTHQCATLRGQSPTILRSKRPDLAKQELYALMISYNALRVLMLRAADSAWKKPVALSFLQTLQAVIDAVPLLNWKEHPHSSGERMDYLLGVIAESEIESARRGRINPRVIKVKMSKFPRKNKTHRGERRDFDKDLSILAPLNRGAGARLLLEAA
jgi:DDE family transposase